ncbi:32802_t:CDS:10, partial [Gigaspora margarita]
KANASPININNSTISGSGIGTIERGIFTSVSPKKRVQKETNPRKRANNATAQRIKKTKTAKGLSASDSFTDESQKFDEHGAEEESRSHTEIRAIASQHNPPYEVPSFSSDFTTPPTNADIDVAKTIDSIPVTEDDRPEDATVDDAGKITSDESESPTAEKAEKSKTILSWEHVVDKIKISDKSNHDWLVNGYNISKDFRNFQIHTVGILKNNPTLSYATDVDKILPLTPVTLPIRVQLIIMEYNNLLTDRKVLREKWRQNWAKCDASMTEREANIFECVQLVTRNFFLNISSLSSTSNNVMDEDTFVHRYCHLMLEEIFNVTNYKLFWANGESSSSKERRRSDGKKHGRKPDFRLTFGEKNEIVFGEIKPPCAANNVINHALIKLGEFMKGSLDSLHEQFGYSQCSETFGIIIKGCQVELFGMDLAFDGLYRFKKVGRALLPTEDANFLNIVSVISNFYSLLEKADRSIEELNRPSTPTGQSYHRESNSSPHKVHIPVLKISPPALSD